jgi:hypothetical protein
MTTRFLYKFALVVSLATVAPLSEATSQCRIKGGCIDETSAWLVGSIEIFEKKCAEIDPSRAEQYHEKARESLSTGNSNEDADFLRRLHESTIYTQVLPKIESQVDAQDRKQLQQNCRRFFLGFSRQEATAQ